MNVFKDVFVGSVFLGQRDVSTVPFLQPALQTCICVSSGSCLALILESSGYHPLSVTYSHDLYLIAEPRERMMCAGQARVQCDPAYEGQ